jgi:hypothetical protein
MCDLVYTLDTLFLAFGSGGRWFLNTSGAMMEMEMKPDSRSPGRQKEKKRRQ